MGLENDTEDIPPPGHVLLFMSPTHLPYMFIFMSNLALCSSIWKVFQWFQPYLVAITIEQCWGTVAQTITVIRSMLRTFSWHPMLITSNQITIRLQPGYGATYRHQVAHPYLEMATAHPDWAPAKGSMLSWMTPEVLQFLPVCNGGEVPASPLRTAAFCPPHQ